MCHERLTSHDVIRNFMSSLWDRGDMILLVWCSLIKITLLYIDVRHNIYVTWRHLKLWRHARLTSHDVKWLIKKLYVIYLGDCMDMGLLDWCLLYIDVWHHKWLPVDFLWRHVMLWPHMTLWHHKKLWRHQNLTSHDTTGSCILVYKDMFFFCLISEFKSE